MSGLVAAALAIGGLTPAGTGGERPMIGSRADDLPFELPAAAAEDRRRLTDAVKKASRIGEKDQPSVADFDAAVNFGWGRKAAHLYILPLELEDALGRHDATNPAAKLGGPPLDFHAVDKNLVLCVGGVHDLIRETLCEYLTGLVGRKVEASDIGRVVVDHLKGLPAKERGGFIARLVAAQKCLRSAARETSLALVSDEADCARVIKRVGDLGAEPKDVLERIAKANKEFKAAFEKCVKAAADPSEKK